MKVEVEMLAFGKPDEIREVTIEDHQQSDDIYTTLCKIFYWGQNDFQPKRQCSVSVSDVIRLNGEKYLVCGMGFRKLTDAEYQTIIATEQRDRSLLGLMQEENI